MRIDATRTAAVAALLVLASIAGIGLAPSASAICAAPTVQVTPGPIVRGTDVTVTGEWWGSDCYDTGDPPAEEGFLGVPASDIDVTILQDGRGWVVARGAADAEYGFTVTAPVSADLAPGPALLVAQEGGDVLYPSTLTTPIEIADVAPVATPAGLPVTFGPATDEAVAVASAVATPGANDVSEDGDVTGVQVAAGLVLFMLGFAAGATAFTARQRRSQQV